MLRVVAEVEVIDPSIVHHVAANQGSASQGVSHALKRPPLSDDAPH